MSVTFRPDRLAGEMIPLLQIRIEDEDLRRKSDMIVA